MLTHPHDLSIYLRRNEFGGFNIFTGYSRFIHIQNNAEFTATILETGEQIVCRKVDNGIVVVSGDMLIQGAVQTLIDSYQKS